MGQRQVLCVRSVKVNILAGCFLGGAGAAATPPAAAIAAALGRLMGDGRLQTQTVGFADNSVLRHAQALADFAGGQAF